jgi:putative membrane protein
LAAVGVIGLVSNFFYALLLGPSIGIAWYFWWGAYYKNLQYCVKDTYFTKVTGVYDISQIYFYWHKIQAIRVHTTPFMRRNNLVSIEFFTAGGSVKLPYIKESKARFIVNQAIYKVETSKLSWM